MSQPLFYESVEEIFFFSSPIIICYIQLHTPSMIHVAIDVEEEENTLCPLYIIPNLSQSHLCKILHVSMSQKLLYESVKETFFPVTHYRPFLTYNYRHLR